jgi:cold shock CspA family protein
MGDIINLDRPKKLDDIRTGEVKWWSDIRRMGYIISGGEEFLITGKKPSKSDAVLREGTSVRFVPYESIRGLEARDVEVI